VEHPGGIAPARRRGLNIDVCTTTLGTANVSIAEGQFRRSHPGQYTINANDQLKKATDYNDL